MSCLSPRPNSSSRSKRQRRCHYSITQSTKTLPLHTLSTRRNKTDSQRWMQRMAEQHRANHRKTRTIRNGAAPNARSSSRRHRARRGSRSRIWSTSSRTSISIGILPCRSRRRLPLLLPHHHNDLLPQRVLAVQAQRRSVRSTSFSAVADRDVSSIGVLVNEGCTLLFTSTVAAPFLPIACGCCHVNCLSPRVIERRTVLAWCLAFILVCPSEGTGSKKKKNFISC